VRTQTLGSTSFGGRTSSPLGWEELGLGSLGELSAFFEDDNPIGPLQHRSPVGHREARNAGIGEEALPNGAFGFDVERRERDVPLEGHPVPALDSRREIEGEAEPLPWYRSDRLSCSIEGLLGLRRRDVLLYARGHRAGYLLDENGKGKQDFRGREITMSVGKDWDLNQVTGITRGAHLIVVNHFLPKGNDVIADGVNRHQRLGEMAGRFVCLEIGEGGGVSSVALDPHVQSKIVG